MAEKGSRPALFPPTYRLMGYCVVVGILGAVAALGFDFLVELAHRHLLVGVGGYEPPGVGVLDPVVEIPEGARRLLIPVVTTLGGLASGLLVFRYAPEAEGHGTDAAVSAYHHKGGRVLARIPLVKALASALTIGSGGVAGREGPTAQISVGLGASLGRWLGLRGQERRILLLASMAGGLAAVFQAPLGMAIFAVEILYAGLVFESEALVYTVISATTAYALHGFFAGWSPIFAIPSGLTFHHPLALGVFALLGVAAGALGAVLPTLFYRTRELFARLPGPPHLRPALGGLLVGLLGMAVPEILGTGYGWVELAMVGSLPLSLLLLIMVLKGPAMALTIGSGGSGGVFGPTVVIGAMLGGVAGALVDRLLPGLGVHPASFVVVGMAAVFSGAARTPLSTLIMTAEMTGGYGLIVPAMVANLLAFEVQRTLTTGRRYPTLYQAQVTGREDSPVHRGVFVRRAMALLEGGEVDAKDLSLPRLVSLLKYGEPVPVTSRGAMLVSVRIEPDAPLDGSTVAEGVGRVEGAVVVAVLHGESLEVPRGPTRLEAGHQLIAVATEEAYARLRQLADAPAGDGAP